MILREGREQRTPWSPLSGPRSWLCPFRLSAGAGERKVRTRCGDKAHTLPQLTEGGREFQKGEREGGRVERKGGKQEGEEGQAVKPHSQA